MADKVLESLFCSICIGLINDPVSIETGHSFCRECISRWFLTSYTCPMTNKRLSTKTVIPNHTLRTVIDDYQQQHCKKIPRSSVELHEQIGRGSFKVVYKATLTLPNQPRPRQVAGMIVQSGDVSTEITNLLKIAKHPNLVTFIGQCEPESDNSTERILITEFAPKGALDQLVSDLEDDGISLSLEHQIEILYQVSRGMEALGIQNLVHRDLALRNILVFQLNIEDASKTFVKVSDFGLTLDTYSQTHRYVEGGPRPLRWLAPETLKKNKFSPKSDVWAFGVLGFELVSDGTIPYAEINEEQVRKHVMDGNKLQQPSECSSTPLWNIINVCFETIPNKRPTFPQLTGMLGQMISSTTSPTQPSVVSLSEHLQKLKEQEEILKEMERQKLVAEQKLRNMEQNVNDEIVERTRQDALRKMKLMELDSLLQGLFWNVSLMKMMMMMMMLLLFSIGGL